MIPTVIEVSSFDVMIIIKIRMDLCKSFWTYGNPSGPMQILLDLCANPSGHICKSFWTYANTSGPMQILLDLCKSFWTDANPSGPTQILLDLHKSFWTYK